jgi:hypothetical protein
MCQQIVFGTDYGTRKFDLGSGAEFLCKKSLFYGPVESYFAAYDSVVLTGPRWHGWGVAPEGAGSLDPPGRAPQQGARRWVCGQTSASAGAGWQGVGERGRVRLREKWLCFSYALPILLRGKQGTSQRQGWNLARDLAVGTNAGCACVSGPAPSPQPRRSPRRPASPKGSRK